MPEESKISKAQQKAVQKYVKNNYDRVVLTLPKGKRETIKEYAGHNGESMNGFINRAIDEAIERDTAVLSPTAAPLVIDQQPAQEQHVQPPTATSECTKHGPRKPFTKEAAAQIDTEKLLHDFRYQLDIGLAYGDDVLAKLLSEARQQPND